MIIESTRFGAFEYEESSIIHFANGIPGFKDNKNYILADIEDSPFVFMQSVEDEDLTFIVASPFDFHEAYEFELPQHLKTELQLQDESHIKVYNIVTISGLLDTATMNLIAPIIINTAERNGVQYILSEGNYSIKHPLFLNSLSEEGGK
ncbi:flagellar assembly protein FliW [Paenibacillus sp. NPDC058174]|uniref:flagellar assembly protein FliW n=1 Tax=Paenibacillus sp. NPDC058174 TaxID=3346366 RepID=UPI0036D9C305